MSRGLGTVQQDILATLATNGDNWTYNSQLAQQLGKPPRQTLNALAALTRRGLIETRRERNRTSARTLHDDGTARPEPPTEAIARRREAAYEAEKAAYFHAMDEVLSRGISFTARDVRTLIHPTPRHESGFPANHSRIMAGVFSTYLRKRYIEKVGEEKSILGQSVNRYAPLPEWYHHRRPGRGH